MWIFYTDDKVIPKKFLTLIYPRPNHTLIVLGMSSFIWTKECKLITWNINNKESRNLGCFFGFRIGFNGILSTWVTLPVTFVRVGTMKLHLKFWEIKYGASNKEDEGLQYISIWYFQWTWKGQRDYRSLKNACNRCNRHQGVYEVCFVEKHKPNLVKTRE